MVVYSHIHKPDKQAAGYEGAGAAPGGPSAHTKVAGLGQLIEVVPQHACTLVVYVAAASADDVSRAAAQPEPRH